MAGTGQQSIRAGFAAHFDSNPRVYRAPARVNIIGEHTDYNDGYVLPTTTALYTWVAAAARQDRVVRAYSEYAGQYAEFSLDDITASKSPAWQDYIKGVALMLESDGHALRGADLYIDGNIPVGGGLSSSASLELVCGMAMLGCADLRIPAADLARICQRAESEFVGLACGIMDQFAVACCAPQNALLLDCRSEEIEFVPLPDTLRLLVVDSGVKHQLPGDGYNDRTEECAAAVDVLRLELPELQSLRDLTLADLRSSRANLKERLFRRCRHVVSENSRTVGAQEALAAVDLPALGRLLKESHASLRDDYEVSCKDVDTLVDIANHCDGVLGARMVGAGFGGCIVAAVHADDTETARAAIVDAYAPALGRMPWSHIVSAANAAERMPESEGSA